MTVVTKIALLWTWRDFPLASIAIFTAPELWLLYHIFVPNAGGLGRVTTRIPDAGREVWLTVDDGPDPRTTPAVLDLLDRHGAKATFFLIGKKVRAHPELAREIVRRGHGLGNHTESHPLAFFWVASAGRTAREIDACSEAIFEVTGLASRLFRSPAGIKNLFLFGVLAARGMSFLGWSARGREHGCRHAGIPLKRLIAHVRPGAVILLHESGPGSEVRMAVVTGLLDYLSREGYRCVLPDFPLLPTIRPGPRSSR